MLLRNVIRHVIWGNKVSSISVPFPLFVHLGFYCPYDGRSIEFWSVWSSAMLSGGGKASLLFQEKVSHPEIHTWSCFEGSGKGNYSFALLFFKTHRCHQWDQNGFWCCANVTKAPKSRSLVECGHSFDTREDLMNIHHFCPLPQYINDQCMGQGLCPSVFNGAPGERTLT